MNPNQDREQLSNEEEDMLLTMELGGISVVPFAVKTALEMNLFDIIAKAGPQGTHLSPSDLASRIGTENPDAPMMIDRVLCFLASYSVVTCKFVKDKDGREFRVYGLGRIGRKLIQDDDGVSMAPWILLANGKILNNVWFHLTESILEGGETTFGRAYGKPLFEYMESDENFREKFNETMGNHTKIVMSKILQIYNGFEGLNDSVLVDVGGNKGANLGLIVSKYPRIKGINFDLPHVVKDAPHVHGVEHVGGDMFREIPQGQTIFMKWILHDWSDEKCTVILKNCRKALPKSGKVIILESILPNEVPGTDLVTRTSLNFDLRMMAGSTVGGKERTKMEFEALAKEAGFDPPKFICRAYSYWIFELYKN